MNRLKEYPPSQSEKRLISYSQERCWPTAIEMTEFAGQFSKPEWTLLCQDQPFVRAVGGDLREAGSIAGTLLKKYVFIWV